MPKQENDIRIIKYLEGEMSREEEFAFEEDLKYDPELRNDLDFHLSIDKVTTDKELDENHTNYLQKFRGRHQHFKDKPFIDKKSIIFLSGFFFILSLVLGWYILSDHSADGPELFSKYYTTYELTNNYRATGNVEIDRGLRAYNKKHFEESLLFFENLLKTEPHNAKAHFAAGISALELNETKKAEAHFSQILKSENLEFYQHAQWYLALTYLKMKKVQEAEVLLIALRNTGGFYHKQATEIVKSME